MARDHRPCWPGPDRRPSGQQAADRERTCPRAMTHRAESGIGGLRITHYRTYPLSNHERRDSIVLCFLTFFSIRLSKCSIFSVRPVRLINDEPVPCVSRSSRLCKRPSMANQIFFSIPAAMLLSINLTVFNRRFDRKLIKACVPCR